MQRLALLHAAYFVLTGTWPILHVRSFLRVTGPKTDLWLVKTVGVLIVVIGLTLGIAGWRGQINSSIATLAIGSALSLMLVDVIYVFKGVIPRIYLLDAIAEIALIIAWIVFWLET